MKNNRISRAACLPLAFLAATVLVQTSFAQTQTEPPVEKRASDTVVALPTPILSVAMPPNARLRFDLDAQDEDVLGLVKSLLRGFNGQSLKGLLDSMNSSTASLNANDGAMPSTPATGSSTIIDKATIQMLADADLGSLLRDVSHLRVVYFEVPISRRTTSSSGSTPANALGVVSFYQQKYINGEGGRRIARADFDEAQMLTVGFPGRGFAVVLQYPGAGIVVRADGYPNLESVGPIAMAAFLHFAPLMR